MEDVIVSKGLLKLLPEFALRLLSLATAFVRTVSDSRLISAQAVSTILCLFKTLAVAKLDTFWMVPTNAFLVIAPVGSVWEPPTISVELAIRQEEPL